MKNKDLSNAIGNINLKYVEEAENFTAKRMSLTKIVSLAACIAIIATSIPLALVLNKEDAQTDAPVETTPFVIETTEPDNANENSIQIIYCDANTAAEIKKADSKKDIEFRDISEIETDLSNKVGDIEASAEIPARLYKTIGEKDYTLKFSSAYSTVLATSTNEQLRKNGSIAVYEIEGKDISEARMEYCYESGRIVYLRLQSISDLIEGNLTSDQALVLAERDLTALYGEAFLHTYTVEFSNLESHGSKNYYSVQYRRMIYGYPTDEVVTANYNMNGELINVVANNLGTFDHISDNLDIDKIHKAEAEALDILGKTQIEYTYLTVDKDGEVYLYVAYTDGYTFQLYYAIDGSETKPRVD